MAGRRHGPSDCRKSSAKAIASAKRRSGRSSHRAAPTGPDRPSIEVICAAVTRSNVGSKEGPHAMESRKAAALSEDDELPVDR